MRILHTSDWHLGKPWGYVERLDDMDRHVIPEIIDIAVRERVDLMVIAGDIFDGFGSRSFDLCAELLTKHLRSLLVNGVNVAITPGNHDHWGMFKLIDASLKLHPVAGPARLVVFAEPGQHEFGKLQVFGLPYLSPTNFDRYAAKMGVTFQADTPALHQSLSYLYERLLQDFIGRRLDGTRPALFIGHFAVAGAKLKAGDDEEASSADFEVNYAYDLSVSHEALLRSDQVPQYNALGHVHIAQQIGDAVAPTYYSGAPDRLDIGERARRPQVWLVDVPNRGHIEVRPAYITKATPFIREHVSDQAALRALADHFRAEERSRVLGELTLEVAEDAEFGTLQAEALDLFPRLAKADTVRRPAAQQADFVKLGDTLQYERISNPDRVMAEYFTKNYPADKRPILEEAYATIMNELFPGGRQ